MNVTGAPPALAADGKGAPPARPELSRKPARSSLAAIKKEAIEEIVEITGDAGSSRRFRQLYEIADKAGLLSEWDAARKATEQALKRARKPVEAPGAYFATILTRGLNEQGVAVPVGSPAERSEVRSLIALSLGGEVQNV